MNSTARTESFHTTRWTRVLAAKGDSAESKAALADLCEAYYSPVHAFIRHTVRHVPEDEIRDLTHEFFARLLGEPRLDALMRGRGKFRSYLLGAVKHFLTDHRKRAQAAKRGSGQAPLPLDENLSLPDTSTMVADSNARFDRQWALALVERALGELATGYVAAGNADVFHALKPWLNGDGPTLSQAQVASQLDMSEGAVKVAIHRLRRRFRELITAEVRDTVASDGEVSIELNYLIEVLGQSERADETSTISPAPSRSESPIDSSQRVVDP